MNHKFAFVRESQEPLKSSASLSSPSLTESPHQLLHVFSQTGALLSEGATQWQVLNKHSSLSTSLTPP